MKTQKASKKDLWGGIFCTFSFLSVVSSLIFLKDLTAFLKIKKNQRLLVLNKMC